MEVADCSLFAYFDREHVGVAVFPEVVHERVTADGAKVEVLLVCIEWTK